MKAIIKFMADDGVEFGQREACEAYEVELRAIRTIMRRLESRPADFPYDKAIQHPVEVLKEVLASLVEIAEGMGLKAQSNAEIPTLTLPPASFFLDRLIDDSNHLAMKAAWFRMCCCDVKGREWKHPDFALDNPN
jgi:hypothetical protein